MKTIKKSVALFLAVVIALGSFAMLASAEALYNWELDTKFYRMQRNADGYIVDADGNVIADENDVLIEGAEPVWIPADGRAAKGETVRARVFITTDFALATSTFMFFYPTDFLTHDMSSYAIHSGEDRVLPVNTDPNTKIGANGFSGTVVSYTDIRGWIDEMIYEGYLDESDMEGKGWAYVNIYNAAGGALTLDGTEWFFELTFTVNEDAADVGQFYLSTECIADYDNWLACTVIAAQPDGDGGDFGEGVDSSCDVDTGTFGYTLNDTDENSSLSYTTATLTFDANGGTFADGSAKKTETADIQPTKAATLPDAPSAPGGIFLGWVNADVENPTEDDILKASEIKYGYYDVTYKAFYQSAESSYIQNVYVMNTDGSYPETPVKTNPGASTDDVVYAADYVVEEGFALDTDHENFTESVKVTADGNATLNIYVKRNQYTIKFGENSSTPYYGAEYEAPEAPVVSGKNFTGWKNDADGTILQPGEKAIVGIGGATYTAQYESLATVAIKVKYVDPFKPSSTATQIIDVATVNTIAGYTVALSATEEGTDDVNKITYYPISTLPEIRHFEYDAENTASVTAAADGSTVLYVAYKPVNYTVEFVGAETFNQAYGSSFIVPAVPEAAGKIAAGWETEDGNIFQTAGTQLGINGNYKFYPTYADITVAFNGEEGVDYPEGAVVPTVSSVKYGDPVVIADPEPVTGWNFLGWNDPVGAVEKNGTYYYDASDVTVTGNWEHVEYTITFWLDKDKTVWYDTFTYFYGDSVDRPEDPTDDLMPAGQEFVDWETEIPETMPAENLDIIATSNTKMYEVKITTSYGREETEYYYYGTDITMDDLADYISEEGWSFDSVKINGRDVDLESNPYTVVGKTGINIIMTLNSHPVYFWMTEEDYEAFLAGDETVEPYNYNPSVEFEAPIVVPVDPSREGYKFLGWDVEPSIMEDQEMHFFADWKINTYTVTWDNEGEKTEVPYEYGATITKLADPEDKTGYTFGGWSLYEDGMKMPANDVTFTAIWNADTFDAVFYVDDEVYATVPTVYGQDIVAPAAPEKDGYDFGGWTPSVGKMDAEGKVFEAIMTPKGNIPYTVSIYTMDTTGAYGNPEVLKLSAATDAPVSYAPETKEGFELDTANSVLSGTVAANGSTNLVVKYIRNQYTFKTVVDGEETSSTTYYYGAAVAEPTTPTKTGHTFSGWDKAVPATMPANDVTLSGTFSKAQFDLIYMVDGKQYGETTKVTFGETVTVIDALTKEGYTFSGWDKTGTFEMPAETVTISGTFAINSYKVIYKVDGNVVHEATAEYNSKVDLYDYTPAEGYNFSGWDKVDGFTMPAEDVTVNGTTSKIAVTVTYKFIGDVPADYPEPAPVTATYGESVLKYNIYEGGDLVTGYVSTLVSLDGAVEDRTAEYPYVVGTEDITITYSWSRVRAYITTTYTGDVPAGYETTEDWSKRYNDTFTLTTPTEEGYTFKGWTVEGAAEYDAATGIVKVGVDDITITGAWEINKHDVIYMVDGVEYARVEDVAYGTPVTVIDDLVEAGKTFSGWDKTGTFTMPDEDVIINGSWTINNYTVTFYTDKDKTEVYETKTGFLGKEYNVPVDPEKEGHKFLGWFNVADDSVANLPEAGIITAIPLGGAEYYATWEKLSYKLIYAAGENAQFSDGTSQKSFNVAYGTAQADWDVPAETLTRPGYTFGGWDMSGVPATMGTKPVRVDAIWNAINYTVTWIDGEDEIVDNYIYGEEILAPEMGKEGWTFLGWLEADGETYFSDGDVMGEKSLVYTAQWEGEDGIEYTVYKYFEKLDKSGWETAQTEVLTGKAGDTASVTAEDEAVEGFYIDGENSVFSAVIEGDGSTALVIYYYRNIVNVTVKDPEGETYINDEFVFGEEIALAKPEKEGFTFVEWQDAKGNVVTFPMTAPADDIIIKPIWSANEYTITFVDEDGTVIEAAKKLAFGSTIVAPAAPEKDGYKFAYWRDAETKAVMPATMPAMNVTYEAFYTAGEDTTYYIEVYMMDTNGDYTMASQTVATGTTGDPISITPGNVEGCTYDADKSVLTGVITADGKAKLEIYYARKLLNVTFKSGEGTFADGTKEIVKDVYFGAAIPVPAQPTRAGYDFAGWNNEVPATMPADNLTFTATWTEAEYTITYVVNDKIEEIKTYKFGEAVETPKTPNVAGMTFKNWSMDIPATMPAEDLIIIAVFEISVYEVKYIVDGVVFQQYSVAHGDEIPVPAEVPTKKYHTFKGWSEIPATMPAQDVEIHAIFVRDDIELVPMDGSTTVIDDEKMAIYGLDIYLVEKDLRESFLKVNGDGDFRVIPSKGTACGTGTVIELYDNANPDEPIKTYTIVIFGDVNGDGNITTTDYSLAQAEYDMLTFWSDPMDESYNPYKTMAADLNGDGVISVKEPASIHRFVLSAVDIDQTNGDVIQCF